MAKSDEISETSENEREEEEIIILTNEDCAPCKVLKKALENVETKVKYRLVDVNSEEGKAILDRGTEKLQLPLAIKVKTTVKVEECELFFDSDTVLVKDKNGELTPIKE